MVYRNMWLTLYAFLLLWFHGLFVIIYVDLLALKVDTMCFTQKDTRMLRDKCLADISRGTIKNFPASLSS